LMVLWARLFGCYAVAGLTLNHPLFLQSEGDCIVAQKTDLL